MTKKYWKIKQQIVSINFVVIKQVEPTEEDSKNNSSEQISQSIIAAVKSIK